jgi:beta-phosphoglucomutase-like phosphatase (HAD superfamily)
MALQKANVQPYEAVVIENAPLGVRAGVDAQIFTVALNTGILANEELATEGANVVLPSMKDFYEKLPQLLSL